MNAKYKKGPRAQVGWCKPDCNPSGGVGGLSTSRYKRLDTELAEDTWTDPRLWSQLNTSLLCLSQENTLPPSLIVSAQICSFSVLCPTTSLCPPLVSRPSSSCCSLSLCAAVRPLDALAVHSLHASTEKAEPLIDLGPKCPRLVPDTDGKNNTKPTSEYVEQLKNKQKKKHFWINPGTINGKTFKPN